MPVNRWYAALALVLCGSATALNPQVRLQDLNHTVWSERDGVPGDVRSMAQTGDGWLWLGTGDGLYRFDGVRFERFPLPPSRTVQRNQIYDLHAAPNGDLLVSYVLGGLSLLHPDGTLTDLIDPAHDPIEGVGAMAVDSDGSIWVAGMHGVYHHVGGRWLALPTSADWERTESRSLALDQYGRLWAANSEALYLYDRAAGAFARFGGAALHGSLIQSPDGRLWVNSADGVRLVPTPPVARALPRAPAYNRSEARSRGQFDRDGNLWALRCPYGLCRVAGAGAAPAPLIVPSRADDRLDQQWQLSALATNVLLEDREGNIWVATTAGLDRFRENKLVPARLPGPSGVLSFAGDTEGRLWAAEPTTGVLWQLAAGAAPRTATGPFVSVVGNDRDGALLLAGKRSIERRYHGAVSQIPLPPGPDGKAADLYLLGMLDDGKVLWIASRSTGLMGLKDGRWLPASAFPLPPRIFLSAPAGPGALWLSHNNGTLSHYDNGQTSTYDIAMVGVESGLMPGPQMVVGGERGLAVLRGGAFVQFVAAAPDVLHNVTGMAITADGDRWLNGAKGVVHVRRADWQVALERPGHALAYDLIDALDGYPGRAALDNRLPTVYNAGHGQLWFRATGGVVRLETAALRPNPVQPTVQVLRVNTAGAVFAAGAPVRLPPTAQSFDIDYTAPGLRKPEGMRFQYRLAGLDTGWIDAGTRRAAYYTHVAPGHYLFQVRAVNEDGVVSASVASVPLQVTPTPFQTWWFRGLCLAALLALLYLLYRYRLRVATVRLAERLHVRMAERERIARTLHDSFLQSVTAVMLRFDRVASTLPVDGATRQQLAAALEVAHRTVTEGRNQVHELRDQSLAPGGAGDDDGPGDDATGLGNVALELVRQLAGADASPRFKLAIVGEPMPLRAAALAEVRELMREGLRNALLHAEAGLIELTIRYQPRQFTLAIRDDGKGMARMADKPHHWGLTGMRERAARLDASLAFASTTVSGTTVTLVVPARQAYRDADNAAGASYWRRAFTSRN